MKVDLTVFLIIVGCALVTIIPRILPFAIIRRLQLPKPFTKWLSYIPVCLLTALVVQGAIRQTDSIPAINGLHLLIMLPTLFIAIKTKSLLITVITGVLCAALVRLIF